MIPPVPQDPATPEEVRAMMDEVREMIDAARRMSDANELCDMSPLQPHVQSLCRSLSGLPRDEARALLPELESLIAEIDRLSGIFKERFGHMASPPRKNLP